MSDNMKIWSVLSKTDPKHTKGFKRSGGFSGTALKPIWVIQRMTEVFGAAGIGWGMGQPQFQTVRAEETQETLVYCWVSLWHSKDVRSEVWGTGGDKVVTRFKDKQNVPYWQANDEAFKSAYTDAMLNAMKQIGVGADIHMGMYEDQKYLRQVAREFDEEGQKKVDKTVTEQKKNPSDIPPVGFSYNKASGIVLCTPTESASKKSKAGRAFAEVVLNGKIGDKDKVFCFHGSMIPVLSVCAGKECKIVVQEDAKGFFMIEEVLEVDGERLNLVGSSKAEQNARLGASILEWSEDKLQFELDRTGKNWDKLASLVSAEVDRKDSK